MAELHIPNPAVLKERQFVDYDLESQHPSKILTRRQGAFDKNRSKWYKQLYYRRVLEITRSITHPILVQSIHGLITRAGLAEPPLPARPITSRPLAPLSSTGLAEAGVDSANSTRRQQIDDIFDTDGEIVWSRRSSCASASSVGSTFVCHDVRLDNHDERKKEIEEYIDPLLPLSDAPRDRFALICWGERNECHIKSVFFEHASTEAAIWSSIHHAWSASRSRSRNLLKRFLTVKNVEFVTVRLSGRIHLSSHSII